MTVDSLVGEVRLNALANTHVIKSGDQIYHGNKQIFTNIQLQQISGSLGEQVGHEVLVILIFI